MSEQQKAPSENAESKKAKARDNALEKAAAAFADDATEKDETGARRKRDFSYTQNRELSWLRFDCRVLDEAFDEVMGMRRSATSATTSAAVIPAEAGSERASTWPRKPPLTRS